MKKIVYQPKVKYHVGDKKPPPISDGIFAWIPPVLYSKEPYLLDKLGLDAVVFLRFLRLLRYLFSVMSLLACAILIPVDITFNLAHVGPKDRDVLSILTIRNITGARLYAHIAAEYVISTLFRIHTVQPTSSAVRSWFGHLLRLRQLERYNTSPTCIFPFSRIRRLILRQDASCPASS